MCLISSGATHPNWVIGHVGGKVEDGRHSFAGWENVRRGNEESGCGRVLWFFFSFFFFSSACRAGMLEAFVGGEALRGPYRLSDTCYGIVTGKMDK